VVFFTEFCFKFQIWPIDEKMITEYQQSSETDLEHNLENSDMEHQDVQPNTDCHMTDDDDENFVDDGGRHHYDDGRHNGADEYDDDDGRHNDADEYDDNGRHNDADEYDNDGRHNDAGEYDNDDGVDHDNEQYVDDEHYFDDDDDEEEDDDDDDNIDRRSYGDEQFEVEDDGAQNDIDLNTLNLDFYVDDDHNQFIEDYVSSNQDAEQFDFNLRMSDWFVRHKVSYKCGSDVLKIFKEGFNLNIPSDMRTVLKTPRNKIDQVVIAPGVYYHFGIEVMLQKFNFDFLLDEPTVLIDIGIDGVPLFKCSGKELWPIIGRFVDKKKVPPFLIGVWCGVGKPKKSNEFLTPLANEIANLKANGVSVTQDGLLKNFEIRAFVCDTVARSALKGVLGHSSVLGCQNCDLDKVKTINRRIFSTTSGPLRTDQSFKERSATSHHHLDFQKPESHVLENSGIKMVSQFVLDPMHLMDLGLGKRIFKQIYRERVNGKKVNAEQQLNMNMRIVALSALTPNEFARASRSFADLAQWKATEYRQIMLYTGIVLLKDFVDEIVYNHFLLIFCGYRLISHPTTARQNAGIARKLFQQFVTEYPSIYGAQKLAFNVHNLIHMCDYVELYGCADSFAAYSFESYMQEMKNAVKKSDHILQQIYNRFSIISRTNDMASKAVLINQNKSVKVPFPGCHSSFRGYKFDEFILKNNTSDGCCLIDGDIFFEINEFTKDTTGQAMVVGRRYLEVTNFFEWPLVSLSDLGIAYCKTLHTEFELFKIDQVTSKFFRLPYHDGFVLIPILHWHAIPKKTQN
jgi:hypothetical protein